MSYTISAALAAKLGSIAMHVSEHNSADGRQIDLDTARSLADDEEVVAFTGSLGVMVSVRRKEGQ